MAKGIKLGEAGRTEEAVAAYDEVVCRYGGSPAAAIAGQVAKALYNNKVVTLG